ARRGRQGRPDSRSQPWKAGGAMSTVRALPILVALLLAAAGCSGSSSPSTSRTSAGSTSATTQPGSTATTASGAASTDWPQYHHDAARPGAVDTGPAPASLRQQWTSTTPDGDVYAEPLVPRHEA